MQELSRDTRTDIAQQTGDAGEIHFPADQILASTTDPRGVISYANPVFCDVSQFDRAGLIGAPHKIVRHPDMPRGLFHLVWSRLKSGQQVCAYVKNRASDGRAYWVFALMSGLREGFVSVRIRPGSEHFARMQAHYRDLHAEEQGGLSPDRSAASLLARLQADGFADYDAFMGAALDSEMALRFEATGQAPPPGICLIKELTGLIDETADLIREIGSGFRHIRGEPVNMRILAGRLEGAGAAIGTISQNYETMAGEMHGVIERMQCAQNGSLSRMRNAISSGRFAAQVALMLQETAQQLDAIGEDDPAFQDFTARILPDHARRLAGESRKAAADIAATSKEITDFCRQLRRRINGLDVVKLLCRVESGRIGHSDSGLKGIISRLEQFHERTDSYLAQLSSKASQITAKSNAV